MPRTKRRAVGVDAAIVERLKEIARERDDGIRHTYLMRSIIIGAEEPIGAIRRSGKRVSVSMQEYLYLAIAMRAEDRGVSNAKMTQFLVVGSQKHLSKEEIDKGKALAKVKAEGRSEELVVEKKKDNLEFFPALNEPEKENKYERPDKKKRELYIPKKSDQEKKDYPESKIDDEFLSGIHFL